MDFSPEIQGQEVLPWSKAAVAFMGSSEERVSLAIRTLRTRAVERGFLTQGAEMGIDGNWERGRV